MSLSMFLGFTLHDGILTALRHGESQTVVSRGYVVPAAGWHGVCGVGGGVTNTWGRTKGFWEVLIIGIWQRPFRVCLIHQDQGWVSTETPENVRGEIKKERGHGPGLGTKIILHPQWSCCFPKARNTLGQWQDANVETNIC